MARMTGFVFQDEYLAKLRKLTDEELGWLVRAVALYHMSGEEPELEGTVALACDFIRADVDRIEEQYRLKCETNRRNRLGNDGKWPDTGRCAEKGRPSTTVPEDKEKEKANASHDDHHPGAEEVSAQDGDALLRKARSALAGLTDTHEAALMDYREKLGGELVSYAIDRTVANGAKGWAYTAAILDDYLRRGFHTVREAQAADSRYKAARPRSRGCSGKTVLAQQYEQREYREAEMRQILGADSLFS